ELMPRYAELIYNGLWFSPEREMLQALIDKSQQNVEGVVRLKLYKGSARVVGRKSPKSLYSLAHVTFEEDAVYDQRDAEGFIKLNALRLRLAARRDDRRPEPLRYPAGVVAATVSRICFQRPGFLNLKASVNQRSTVTSASGSSELARRTVLMRSSHIAAAPEGLAGSVSHHIAEISLAPCS